MLLILSITLTEGIILPKRIFAIMLTTATLIAASSSAFAQGRAEGGILIRDNVSIYMSSSGPKTRDSELPRGMAVGGVTTSMKMDTAYQFEEDEDRVHVIYVVPTDKGNQESIIRYGWMDKADLSNFTYECGCPSSLSKNRCYPLVQSGFVSATYHVCFKEGASKKLAELRLTWAQDAAPINNAVSQASIEKSLTNDDIVTLSKAGLGDEIVVSKIQQVPRESLDVTIDTLIKLRSEGLGKSILDAMVKRAGLRK